MSGNVPKEIYDTYFSTFNEQIKKLNILMAKDLYQ